MNMTINYNNNSNTTTPSVAQREELKNRVKALLEKEENKTCADCSDPNPAWAIIVFPPRKQKKKQQLGSFCCVHCSTSHDMLEDDITIVRSFTSDFWLESEVKALEQSGNHITNEIFEGNQSSSNDFNTEKPTKQSAQKIRINFIRSKYERLKYFDSDMYNHYCNKLQQQEKKKIESDFTMSWKPDFGDPFFDGTTKGATTKPDFNDDPFFDGSKDAAFGSRNNTLQQEKTTTSNFDSFSRLAAGAASFQDEHSATTELRNNNKNHRDVNQKLAFFYGSAGNSGSLKAAMDSSLTSLDFEVASNNAEAFFGGGGFGGGGGGDSARKVGISPARDVRTMKATLRTQRGSLSPTPADRRGGVAPPVRGVARSKSMEEDNHSRRRGRRGPRGEEIGVHRTKSMEMTQRMHIGGDTAPHVSDGAAGNLGRRISDGPNEPRGSTGRNSDNDNSLRRLAARNGENNNSLRSTGRNNELRGSSGRNNEKRGRDPRARGLQRSFSTNSMDIQDEPPRRGGRSDSYSPSPLMKGGGSSKGSNHHGKGKDLRSISPNLLRKTTSRRNMGVNGDSFDANIRRLADSWQSGVHSPKRESKSRLADSLQSGVHSPKRESKSRLADSWQSGVHSPKRESKSRIDRANAEGHHEHHQHRRGREVESRGRTAGDSKHRRKKDGSSSPNPKMIHSRSRSVDRVEFDDRRSGHRKRQTASPKPQSRNLDISDDFRNGGSSKSVGRDREGSGRSGRSLSPTQRLLTTPTPNSSGTIQPTSRVVKSAGQADGGGKFGVLSLLPPELKRNKTEGSESRRTERISDIFFFPEEHNTKTGESRKSSSEKKYTAAVATAVDNMDKHELLNGKRSSHKDNDDDESVPSTSSSSSSSAQGKNSQGKNEKRPKQQRQQSKRPQNNAASSEDRVWIRRFMDEVKSPKGANVKQKAGEEQRRQKREHHKEKKSRRDIKNGDSVDDKVWIRRPIEEPSDDLRKKQGPRKSSRRKNDFGGESDEKRKHQHHADNHGRRRRNDDNKRTPSKEDVKRGRSDGRRTLTPTRSGHAKHHSREKNVTRESRARSPQPQNGKRPSKPIENQNANGKHNRRS